MIIQFQIKSDATELLRYFSEHADEQIGLSYEGKPLGKGTLTSIEHGTDVHTLSFEYEALEDEADA